MRRGVGIWASAAAIAIMVLSTAAAHADGDAAAGKVVFNKCRACHSLAPDQNGVGPSLHGLFGRAAGSVEDFRYSPWMKSSGLVWDEATLRRYLPDPQALVKGTKMTFPGLKDPQELTDLVAYLKGATK